MTPLPYPLYYHASPKNLFFRIRRACEKKIEIHWLSVEEYLVSSWQCFMVVFGWIVSVLPQLVLCYIFDSIQHCWCLTIQQHYIILYFSVNRLHMVHTVVMEAAIHIHKYQHPCPRLLLMVLILLLILARWFDTVYFQWYSFLVKNYLYLKLVVWSWHGIELVAWEPLYLNPRILVSF